jgi:1,4-alpha-glucan branching enzyme
MTFSTVYAWDENFVLPISHDEVVHGKGSLLNKMPGDEWQKFANLRAYLGFMWAHPGKKLLFMGCEFAQLEEWNHDKGLSWHLLEDARHRGVQSLVKDLNRTYCDIAALHQQDHHPAGFQWLQLHNDQQSIFAWARYGHADNSVVVVLVNMTPQVHEQYQLGVPLAGKYEECLNTDGQQYGGSGVVNGTLRASSESWDGQAYSLSLRVPPLATLMLEFKP